MQAHVTARAARKVRTRTMRVVLAMVLLALLPLGVFGVTHVYAATPCFPNQVYAQAPVNGLGSNIGTVYLCGWSDSEPPHTSHRYAEYHPNTYFPANQTIGAVYVTNDSGSTGNGAAMDCNQIQGSPSIPTAPARAVYDCYWTYYPGETIHFHGSTSSV